MPKGTYVTGYSFIHAAIVKNNPVIVQILLDAGADANGTNIIGNPVIHETIHHGRDSEIVRMLVDAGADVNAIEKPAYINIGCWDTVLAKAARKGKVEIVRILVDAGADVERERRRIFVHIRSRSGPPQRQS